MKLEIAQTIVAAALAAARTHNFKPLAVAVLDARGALKAFAAEDGTSLKRAEIAIGKAAGALAMGLGSRTLGTMAAAAPAVRRRRHPRGRRLLIPVAGGVLDPRRRRGADRRGGRLRRHLRQRRDGGRGRHRGGGIEGRSRSLSRRCRSFPRSRRCARGLEPVLRGRRFIHVEQRRPDLRFPLPERFVERLTGRTVERLDRRAKYILVHLDSGEVLAVHLGMTGRFSVQLPLLPLSVVRQRHAEGALPARRGEGIQLGEYTYEHGHDAKHDHLVFTMSGGAVVTYNDARRFGYMTLDPRAATSTDHAFFRGPRRRAAGRRR